jgi:hypothetical protein
VWLRSWRTVIRAAAPVNSGTIRPTGSSSSRSPSATRASTVVAVTALVTDPTGKAVCRVTRRLVPYSSSPYSAVTVAPP